MTSFNVVAAAWGALAGGNPDRSEAYIVTEALQRLLDKANVAGSVKIDTGTFGDPAKGSPKHFGAVVAVNGVPTAFACGEGQTIDFAPLTVGAAASS